MVLAAVMVLPLVSHADNPSERPAGPDGYYFGSDEASLRRDITDVRYYYTQADRLDPGANDPAAEFVYFGAGYAAGPGAHWVPMAAALPGPAGAAIPADRSEEIVFGLDWRPDVTAAYYGADTRQIGRALTGSEIERIGLRADVTALLLDHSGASTTAWRVTGALGSTSLSLASAGVGAPETGGGLLWDVGVGWSSGAVSLSVGYQSASRVIEDGGDVTVLSLGADYTFLPGMSVYGELNLIDDPVLIGPERLGTVFILGTGLNF